MATASPRKFVPLAPGHDPTILAKSSSPSADISLTKRAFFAAVVVEEGIYGISQDAQELITALGTRITEPPKEGVERSASAPSLAPGGATDLHRSVTTRKRAMTEGTSLHASALGHKRTLTETDTLQDRIREVVTTERTYVKRLQILKQDYADPLKTFAKKKEDALLDKYKVNTLFGNIDQLLPVNEAFLNDLEKMIGPNGQKLVGGLGDVCLKHFRDKRAFDCYKLYYAKREEAQAIFEEEVAKGGKAGFGAYIERIKYSSTDVRNRIGLRELLAEPFQRIPRYTMMWQNIIKEMDESDPQREKLIEAEKIAAKIGQCESDDSTKRAFIMHCLERTIEGFPPGLFSNGRTFVDCIDVEDIPVDIGPASSAASTSSGGFSALFCTLFLFDDRLIIVKRPNGTSSGRALARLDDIQKLLRTNGGLNSLKKSGMLCKGVIDVLDIAATDAGGSDMHLYLEAPPQDQTDRWKGRPFRSYAVVLPPNPINMDPTAAQAAKKRFLDNLWAVQALYKIKSGKCIAMMGEEFEVENKGSKVTRATTFYNLYQRTPYLGEAKKPKVVVHIDPSRQADAIPFGIVGGPFVVIRLQPMPGALVRYTVTCQSPDEDEEEHIVRSESIPGMLSQTIQQFGLFSFRTGGVSRPTTPTASTRSRSRAAVFGLDAISRTLSRSALTSEVFSFGAGGTISTKRSKGGMSRSSTQTMSTALTESTNRFSYRSNSTAATSSFMTSEDESSHGRSSRKLVKRGKSPGPGSDSEPRRSTESVPDMGEEEEVESILNDAPETATVGESEKDLAKQLELAQQNRLSLQITGLTLDSASFVSREPFSDTIYEEEPPPSHVTPERRFARKSADSAYRPESVTPTKASPANALSPPLSTPLRKPSGPRRATLAPPRPTSIHIFGEDVEAALEDTIAAFSPPQFSKRIEEEDTPTKPLFEGHSFEAPVFQTPPIEALAMTSTGSSSASVEPLSIKKKTSVKPRRSPGSFRRIHAPEPVSPTPAHKLTHTSSMIRSPPRVQKPGRKGKEVERIVVVARTTKEDLSSARRAVKRVKQEVEILRDGVAKDTTASRPDRSGATSPTQFTRGIVRSPPTRQITKAAEARMEEMRQMIERRERSNSAVQRAPSITVPVPTSVLDSNRLEEWTKLVESLLEDADKQIAQAIDQNEALVQNMASLAVDDESSSGEELDRLRVDLQSSKRQTDVLKQLLQDATSENEILYAVFNKELESMFDTVELPEDQAWSNMVEDLKRTKQARNQLSKENFQYKQKLQMAEQRNEELLALLKAHGLEPEH